MKAKYKTAKALQAKIDEYFTKVLEEERPMTFTGLAYFLGYATRQSVWQLSKREDELSLPIKKALLRIEQAYEERLQGNSPTGAIFALKNRGWSDRQEIEHSGGVTFSAPKTLDD